MIPPELRSLPVEIKYLILSFLPIHFIIEILTNKMDWNEINNYLLNKNNFSKILSEIDHSLMKLKLDLNALNLKKEEEELIKYLNKNNLTINNIKELKIISRYILKFNFLLFLNNESSLKNILNKFNCNSLEICWIFNKKEILNEKYISEQYCNFYCKLVDSIVKEIDNLQDIFRIHALLYLKENDEIKIDILQIINIKEKINYKKQTINFKQLFLFVNKNKYFNEIIFQTITKGNTNILLKYKSQPSNILSSINLCKTFTSTKIPFTNYYFDWTWIKKLKLIFNPYNKDYYLKCNRSLFNLIKFFLNYTKMAIILLELILVYFGYVFTFKITRGLIFNENIKNSVKILTLLNDSILTSSVIYIILKDIENTKTYFTKLGIIMFYRFITSLVFIKNDYNDACFHIEYGEWCNNFLVLYILHDLLFNKTVGAVKYWKEGLFKLFRVRKLEFCSNNDFKAKIIVDNKKRKSGKIWKWLVVGGLSTIVVVASSVGLSFWLNDK
ncbi:hypothetical protein ABK040_003482 [Willaertia magna]